MSFFSAIAKSIGIGGVMEMLGPTPPVHRSSFRKGSGQRHWKARTGINPQNNSGWWRRNAFVSPPVITERMLMRHGWYRRKLRQQGIWMKESGPNEVMLTGFAPKHFKTRAQIAEQYPS